MNDYHFKILATIFPAMVMIIDKNFHYHASNMFQNAGVLSAAIFGIPIVASSGLIYNFVKGKRDTTSQAPLTVYVASALLVSVYCLYMNHL